jgi:hypothetical protein
LYEELIHFLVNESEANRDILFLNNFEGHIEIKALYVHSLKISKCYKVIIDNNFSVKIFKDKSILNETVRRAVDSYLAALRLLSGNR